MKRRLSVLSLLLFISLLISSFSLVPKTHAISGPQFDPSDIIDNSVFYNASSMSVGQIQAFLNSKIPSCDTNGSLSVSYYYNSSTGQTSFSWFSGGTYISTSRALMGQRYDKYYGTNIGATPYVCLNQYIENPSTQQNNLQNPSASIPGGQSAAQIIYNAGQQYNINPEVLVVLLQKEQGLVTDDWPWTNEYQKATGYACPDTAPCNSQYFGFYNQVSQAAEQYRNYANYPNSFNYVPGPGNYVQYNPNTSCGGTTLNIQNQATASLYDYTPYQPDQAALSGSGDSCSSYGNLNFFNYFVNWFGSPNYSPPACNAQVANVSCVWQLYNQSNDSDFLTIDNAERDAAVANSKYFYDMMPFYAFTSQQAGTVPVYRLRLTNEHFYTTSAAERDSLLQDSQNTYEGIAFYVYPSNSNTNASYPIYRLTGSSGHVFVSTTSERDYLVSQGYTYEGVAFNAPSGFALASDPLQNYTNVYRLSSSKEHFYTTDLGERDALLSNGWVYEGVMMGAPAAATSAPVYRLVNSFGDHMYTASSAERDQMTSNGWMYEGVAWYTDSTTPQVYRFYINGTHFFTTNLDEAFSITNRGAQYEGVAFGNNQSAHLPVYRLFNSTCHFFTGSVDEALSIANTGWKYEGIAWYASPTTTSSPVYRLANGSQHFYTTSSVEENQLISGGWKYEGIAWYASPTTTSSPVYRLRSNSNGDHMYTASSAERDQMTSNGWTYEGVAWYGM